MANDDRTEKATPKHRQRAREKGQVARSAELGGSVVVVAGLLAVTVMGPRIAQAGAESFREILGEISHPARATTAACPRAATTTSPRPVSERANVWSCPIDLAGRSVTTSRRSSPWA